jgi:hypothetical protein
MHCGHSRVLTTRPTRGPTKPTHPGPLSVSGHRHESLQGRPARVAGVVADTGSDLKETESKRDPVPACSATPSCVCPRTPPAGITPRRDPDARVTHHGRRGPHNGGPCSRARPRPTRRVAAELRTKSRPRRADVAAPSAWSSRGRGPETRPLPHHSRGAPRGCGSCASARPRRAAAEGLVPDQLPADQPHTHEGGSENKQGARLRNRHLRGFVLRAIGDSGAAIHRAEPCAECGEAHPRLPRAARAPKRTGVDRPTGHDQRDREHGDDESDCSITSHAPQTPLVRREGLAEKR